MSGFQKTLCYTIVCTLTAWYSFCEVSTGYKTTADTDCDVMLNRTRVNCRDRSLAEVPNETFPDSTETLDLSYNKLQKIPGYTFRTLLNLTWLDLSHNIIRSLNKMAFINLGKLVFLNFNANNMVLHDNSYSPRVFVPLQSLQVLHMEANKCINTSHFKFPTAVAKLLNLRELYTDFPMNVIFDDVFSNLTKLVTLSSSGFNMPRHKHCCVKKLQNSTFAPFKNIRLKHFRLAQSCLNEAEFGVFEPFNHLESLDLSGNKHIGLYKVLQTMYGLRNQNVPYVSLRATNSFLIRAKHDFMLNDESTKFLKSLCIDTLDISRNFLYLKPPGPFFGRRKCLRRLDMSVHSTDPNWLIKALISDRLYPNINFLNISTLPLSAAELPGQEKETALNKTGQEPQKIKLDSLDISFTPMNCQRPLPESLSVSVLNISGWKCSNKSRNFFRSLKTVTHLQIRQANLDTILTMRFAKRFSGIFDKMLNLREVDMSDNDLTSLPDTIFQKNHNLSSLILYNNKLSKIPPKIFETTSLVHLDLSSNVLKYLTGEEMTMLENQKRRHKKFRLSLKSNPFICDCKTLQFLQWLNNTNVVTDFGRKYLCRQADGHEVEIMKFFETFKDFSVSCVSKSWLEFGVGAAFVCIICIIIIYVYYRRRWNIHYWFYTHCRPTVDMLPEREYGYDVFVCYNHNDCSWVYRSLQPFLEHEERGFRLCLHHRDFPAGVEINQNIVDAINNSQKILLVISRNFLQSSWGEYEIEMASMRSVQEGRTSVIISVMLEEVPVRDMPRTLMNLWHRVTFLEWPKNSQEQERFWLRLLEAIGKRELTLTNSI